MNPPELKYTKEHEWVRVVSEGVALVGVTAFAAESLGDVVYLDLPETGTDVEQFAKMGEVESVKAVSDILSPISGEILERNEEAIEHPEKVNEEPYGAGWLVKVSIKDQSQLDSLLTVQEYEAFVAQQA